MSIDKTIISRYANIFTMRYRRRSLFIGLTSRERRCLFTYSSGMFLPNYRAYTRKKANREEDLAILRGMKHKEKKLAKKKSKRVR